MSLIIHEINENNLLTPSNMDTMYQIFKSTINNVTLEYKSNNYTFDSLCLRIYDTYPICYSEDSGLFKFFAFDPTYWQRNNQIQAIVQSYQNQIQVCKFCVKILFSF